MENVTSDRGGYSGNTLSENSHTREDLTIMQGWNLDRKIQVSQTRIIEWYQAWEGKVYVSFSGGKDSTVLADLAARVCKINGCKLILWFSDTGLEYPEVREHVRYFLEYLKDKYGINVELIIDYPRDRKGNRITFKKVIEKYGYPIVSKEVAKTIHDARNAITKRYANSYAMKKLNGALVNENTGVVSNRYNHKKWKFLLDAPFKISHQCCDAMKKSPAHKFEKSSGMKPIIGTMASESALRLSKWLQYGCNAFDGTRQISKPLSFWTEQDVLNYIVKYEVPIASVYGEVVQDDQGKYKTTGCNRTGCVFCGFGCHLEKEPNRFQLLKQTHPQLWEYCMKPWNEGGLGMKEVLEFINVKIE